MARNITIIEGHPDPDPTRLNHALADCYAQAARGAGAEVRRIVVAQLDFPLLRSSNDFYGPLPESIAGPQRDIAWADHILILYPLWHGDVPALLKAFLEQTFRPDFGMKFEGRMRFPKPLFRGKSARIVVTAGMPERIYRWYFGGYSLKAVKRHILGMCGIAPIYDDVFGGVAEGREASAKRWLDRMTAFAISDSTASPAAPRRVGVFFRAISEAGLAAASVYFIWAALTWLRYGKVTQPAKTDDALLDMIMPEYEVRVSHGIVVDAPPDVTFAAINDSSLVSSPLIRALIRVREAFMRGKHDSHELPDGLLSQARAIGWSTIAEQGEHEIVLGAATQPWKANPAFRPLPASDVSSFHEPDYAKIAFSVRADALGAERSIARTETRVKTTDAASRERFRRYWALVLPGVELIRFALLREVKREAERRHRKMHFANP
jgi:putative NADPH-quinone reductase